MLAEATRVSFDDEPLILVNEADDVLGYEAKAACHVGEGVLHRAFSMFLFDAEGRLLVHRRSAEKPLWPGFWTNSCCSHPRRGEEMDEAVRRRVREELGLEAQPRFLYKFRYHARFGKAGSERELCSVFIGRIEGEVRPNPTEIDSWKLLAPEEVDRALADEPAGYTPWFKLEWPRIRAEHWGEVEALR